MAQLGQLLRETREAKGLTLADVERATRIRLGYLEALEAEQFDRLPGNVYARGFLRNYAQFLGLHSEEILASYEDLGGVHPPGKPAISKLRIDDQVAVPLHEARSARLAWAVIVLLLVTALGLGGWWVYRTYVITGRISLLAMFAGSTATPTAPASPTPAIAALTTDPSTATATPAATSTPVETPTPSDTPTPVDTPTLTPSPTPKVYLGVELSIEITDRAWVQVLVDGTKVYEGILEVGEKHTWEGMERVLLRTGNAGGILITLNGEFLGPLGNAGEVMDKEWVKQAVG